MPMCSQTRRVVQRCKPWPDVLNHYMQDVDAVYIGAYPSQLASEHLLIRTTQTRHAPYPSLRERDGCSQCWKARPVRESNHVQRFRIEGPPPAREGEEAVLHGSLMDPLSPSHASVQEDCGGGHSRRSRRATCRLVCGLSHREYVLHFGLPLLSSSRRFSLQASH